MSCNDTVAIQAVISNYLTSHGYSTIEEALASGVNIHHEVGNSPAGTRTFGYGRRAPTGSAPLYPDDFTAVNPLPFGLFEIAYGVGEQRYSSLCLVFGYAERSVTSGLIDVLVTRGQNSGNWHRVRPVINNDAFARDNFYYDRQQLLDELVSAIDIETMASISIGFTLWEWEGFVITPEYGTLVPPRTLLTDALFETDSLAVQARWDGGWPEGIEPGYGGLAGYVDPQVLQEKLRENPTDLGLVITEIMFDRRNPTPAPKNTLPPLAQYDTFEAREATQQHGTIDSEDVTTQWIADPEVARHFTLSVKNGTWSISRVARSQGDFLEIRNNPAQSVEALEMRIKIPMPGQGPINGAGVWLQLVGNYPDGAQWISKCFFGGLTSDQPYFACQLETTKDGRRGASLIPQQQIIGVEYGQWYSVRLERRSREEMRFFINEQYYNTAYFGNIPANLQASIGVWVGPGASIEFLIDHIGYTR